MNQSPYQNDKAECSGRRTWLLRARARGSQEPFRDIRLLAASALQAEAILRRQGLEVDTSSGHPVAGPPDEPRAILAAAPGSLLCTRCGYDLDGLPPRQAIIECPECGFLQVVMAYRPDPQCTVGEQAAQGPGSRSTARNWLANFALAVLFLLLALALLMVWT